MKRRSLKALLCMGVLFAAHMTEAMENKPWTFLVYMAEMYKRYVIGFPLKKSKILVQKPVGIYGLFDAYVLSQIKKFTEIFPAITGFYVLFDMLPMSYQDAIKKTFSVPKKEDQTINITHSNG